jgi:hypothetical protein
MNNEVHAVLGDHVHLCYHLTGLLTILLKSIADTDIS